MIVTQIGNLFESNARTLVNTVNCVGVMGKGIAAEFKKRFPDYFEDYRARCQAGQVKLGEPYIYRDLLDVSIISFPTKDHWRSPARLADIVTGLDYFAGRYKEWEVENVAFPPLGCGNGGLDWAVVGPVIYQKLKPLDLTVHLYAPYGTPREQMSRKFLEKPISLQEVRGRQQRGMKVQWLALLDVIDKLTKQPYASPVGRTLFQKIAFILTEQGLETGFRFQQGSYGPFSSELKQALQVFANSNLIEERRLGRMNAISIGPAFAQLRRQHEKSLATHDRKIARTVDLFSRIKGTEQAEEVATVLYAARRLKKERGADAVSEHDLLSYILEWKSSWDREEKKRALASAIRHLEMLGWLKLRYSDSLPVDDEAA
jgi:O-acetyl-ADP-ribose deacetylase (regulator of RNase III)/uncharacterized protein YwgA